MHQRRPSNPTPRPWTPVEDDLLHHMRFIEHRTWPEVAAALNRSTQAVQARSYQLKIAQSSSFEDWDASMDERIIDGRRRGLTPKEIGVEMDIPGEAMQGRWHELQQQKKVSEDVLAIWRKKGEVKWTEKEDEVIIQAWVDGKDEEEIIESVRFEGKYKCDVRERKRLLFREKGPIYRRLMGLDEGKPVLNALEKALGKKKFAWMQ